MRVFFLVFFQVLPFLDVLIQLCTCHCIRISHCINLPLWLNTHILSAQFFLHVVYTYIYFVCKQYGHQNWISKLYNSAEKSAKCVRIGIFKNLKHCLECLKPKFHWYLPEDHWIEYAVCFTNYFEQISCVVVLLCTVSFMHHLI